MTEQNQIKPNTTNIDEIIQAHLEWLKDHPGPVIGFVPAGDYLSVLWEDVPCYAFTVSMNLKLYKAISDDHVVGCQVIGIAKFLEQF